METRWIYSKALGLDVKVNDKGKVIQTINGSYPYRAKMVPDGSYGWRQDGWDNCSGDYTPSYLARLLREDKAMWH